MSQSKLEAGCSLIKRAIAKRRQQEGFSQPVSSQQWSAAPVRRHLEQASNYLIQNCCEAEWKELAADPHPEDDGLETALLSVSRALNGLMTFSNEPFTSDGSRSAEHDKEDQEKQDHETGAVSAQKVNMQAATDYLHWLMESDNWLQEYRANLPRALTEQEMVDFLLSPLTQVLSFQDFHDLGLCPLTTQGRVTLVKQWETPKSALNKAQQELVRRGQLSSNTLFSDFAAELDTPEGDTIHLSIQRVGEPDTISYCARMYDVDLGSQADIQECGGFQSEDGSVHFPEGGLVDRKSYPTFPFFTFVGYPKSICSETYGLNITLRENEFYSNESAALRFLMMRVNSSLYSVQYYHDSIYVPQWDGFMQTKTVLTVPNWVLPDDLADYWRQIRPKAARQRRLPSAENVELFRFVLCNTSPGTEPQWTWLAHGWSEINGAGLTRDKLFKVYWSVLNALFPGHPSKQDIGYLQEAMQERKETLRLYREEQEIGQTEEIG